MRTRADLFAHQRAAIPRIVAQRQLALMLGLGLGKTATTLHALADLGAWPALVVAPARVVEEDVWGEEAEQWEGLDNLVVTRVQGSRDVREKLLSFDSHVETISYENFVWLSDKVNLARRYRAIVFDELSRMKTPGTKLFKRARARVPRIPVRIGLTGTPVGNHLLDLWGELYAVADEKPFGPSFIEYRQRYFLPVDYYQRVWRVKDLAAEREIHQRAKPWSLTAPEGAGPALPVVYHRVKVSEPLEVRRQTEELRKQLWTQLASGAELEALGATVLTGKLRQIASGAVYLVGEKWEPVHKEKLRALDEVLDELQGEPLLVFFEYRHAAARIEQHLALRGIRAVRMDEPRAVERWNRREVEVLLAHPRSAGHGLNLQHGGHHILWFDLPWSWELWRQANARLLRTGQRHTVTVTSLLCGEVDERVADVLAAKGAVERSFFASLRV